MANPEESDTTSTRRAIVELRARATEINVEAVETALGCPSFLTQRAVVESMADSLVSRPDGDHP